MPIAHCDEPLQRHCRKERVLYSQHMFWTPEYHTDLIVEIPSCLEQFSASAQSGTLELPLAVSIASSLAHSLSVSNDIIFPPKFSMTPCSSSCR